MKKFKSKKLDNSIDSTGAVQNQNFIGVLLLFSAPRGKVNGSKKVGLTVSLFHYLFIFIIFVPQRVVKSRGSIYNHFSRLGICSSVKSDQRKFMVPRYLNIWSKCSL